VSEALPNRPAGGDGTEGRACGDGFVGPGEACGDGEANSDVVADACRTDCTAAGCGDGVIDRDETCDDGHTADGDDCPSDCREVRCGDGVVTPPEVCNDGHQRNGQTAVWPPSWPPPLRSS
jgi:cysteine-rich repeat protein